jgi:hypothetical protein
MKYNYFGMTTKAWSDKHPAGASNPVPAASHPLAFVMVDKCGRNMVDEGHDLLVVRAATSAGRDIIPPMYVSDDKQSLTDDLSKAVRVSIGWKYDRQTNWRAVAANAIKLMAQRARELGVPSNCVREWYE